jgi:putative aminopeptidase FrvX
MRPQSLQFLKTLCATASTTGNEQAIARHFRDYLGGVADSFEVDVSGNAVAALNPDAPMKIMLSGHMDEIGFVVHNIDENGFLFFSPVGGHDSVVPIGQRVVVQGRQPVPGVVGRKAIHVLSEKDLKRKPEMSDLWIDIGASSREQALALVELGDSITFQYEFQQLAGDLVTARAFDNKAGLFIVAETLRLLKEEGGLRPDVGVFAVATVQEEIGSRGATTAAFAIAPRTAIAVDMGQALDYPGIDPREYGVLDIGKGPGISRGANTNPVVFGLLREAAERDGIPHQVSITPGTSPTDAKALQTARGGIATGLLEVPLRYMHTPSEVVSLADVEACARLLAAYCRSITPGTNFTP